MGFFGALGKIIQGKPVFEPGQNQPAAQSGAPGAGVVGQPAPAGPKVYPQVYIERVESRLSGDDMDVDVIIQNYSQGRVELDKFYVYGQRRELDTFLEPGEERTFKLFTGDRPRSNRDTMCELYFKDATGDYFSAEHRIEYRQEADGTYSIDRIRFMRIRDI